MSRFCVVGNVLGWERRPHRVVVELDIESGGQGQLEVHLVGVDAERVTRSLEHGLTMQSQGLVMVVEGELQLLSDSHTLYLRTSED